MVQSDFERNLIQEKERRFLAAVSKASKFVDVLPPAVKFWETKCPDQKKNEWAHIHLGKNRSICVSIRNLGEMNFDDIEETATHEVTHIVQPDHCDAFHSYHRKMRPAIWRPTGGVAALDGGKRLEIEPPAPMPKPSKTRCNYSPCRKKERLFECRLCHGFFCGTHKKPSPPMMPNFKSSSREEIQRMDLYRNPNQHPCPRVVEILRKKAARDGEKFRQAIDTLLKPEPKMEAIETSEPNKANCNYHLCRKEERTYECKFCHRFFCRLHRKPVPPMMPAFKSTSREDKERLETIYRDPNMHPCPHVVEHFREQQRLRDERYLENLDTLIGSPRADRASQKMWSWPRLIALVGLLWLALYFLR